MRVHLACRPIASLGSARGIYVTSGRCCGGSSLCAAAAARRMDGTRDERWADEADATGLDLIERRFREIGRVEIGSECDYFGFEWVQRAVYADGGGREVVSENFGSRMV